MPIFKVSIDLTVEVKVDTPAQARERGRALAQQLEERGFDGHKLAATFEAVDRQCSTKDCRPGHPCVICWWLND